MIERESEDQYWARRYQFIAEVQECDQKILKALKGIDRAREKLIEAQNNLAAAVTGANDYTREKFTTFYNAGGVTPEDWETDLRTDKYQRAHKIVRGQLRLVIGDRSAK